MQAYEAGQRIFGESRVQELLPKYEVLPKDIEWHFIGHLQSNKVKHIAPFVSLIHGVDSYALLEEINRCGKKIGRIVPCLLQVHIAQEETKYGFSFDELRALLQQEKWQALTNISIRGLMGMASYTDNEEKIKQEFHSLSVFFKELKATYFAADNLFCELSMGMSGDYSLAIREGSTLIRIGSAIFGERNY
jgi:pyridoxal phosphate enzyme (YggS family)